MLLKNPEGAKERLLAGSVRNPETECLIWQGTVSAGGYGVVHWERRQRLVHRLSHTLWVAPLELGQVVAHHCDQSLCLEPSHLMATTQRQNLQDCCRRGRQGVRLTPETVQELYALRGANARLIAPRYGISPRQVLRIWSGVQWGYVTGAHDAES